MTFWHHFSSVTYKLSSIFKNLLPIFIFGIKLLQEPFTFICKQEGGEGVSFQTITKKQWHQSGGA